MDPDLDPDPNWAKILDSDPNSMYLDPQHCHRQVQTGLNQIHMAFVIVGKKID